MNTTNFHPTGQMLLLKSIPEADTTKGGLFIPPQYRQTLNMGIVIELGPDVPIGCLESKGPREPYYYEVGDTVVFHQHTEHRIQFDRDQTYFVVDIANVVLNDLGYSAAQPKTEPEPPKQPEARRKPIGMDSLKNLQ